MFTGITAHAGSLVTAIVVLIGAAILRGGAASADPNQDDQFLALLHQPGDAQHRYSPPAVTRGHQRAVAGRT